MRIFSQICRLFATDVSDKYLGTEFLSIVMSFGKFFFFFLLSRSIILAVYWLLCNQNQIGTTAEKMCFSIQHFFMTEIMKANPSVEFKKHNI